MISTACWKSRMAEVTLHIGGHDYRIACADGEEAALHALGSMVEREVQAARALGGLNESRQLLFAALFLADKLANGGAEAAPSPSQSGDDRALDALAQRVEAITARLATIRQNLG